MRTCLAQSGPTCIKPDCHPDRCRECQDPHPFAGRHCGLGLTDRFIGGHPMAGSGAKRLPPIPPIRPHRKTLTIFSHPKPHVPAAMWWQDMEQGLVSLSWVLFRFTIESQRNMITLWPLQSAICPTSSPQGWCNVVQRSCRFPR